MSTAASGNYRDTFVLPIVECFTPTVARRIVETPVEAGLQATFDELADKANEGQLTDDERRKYDDLLDGLAWISTLKARARAFLRRKGA